MTDLECLKFVHIEDTQTRGAWLPQSEECATLDVRVVNLKPTLGVVEIT